MWEEWKPPVGDPIHSYTVITMPPNGLVAALHYRMAAMLRRAQEDAELDTTDVSPQTPGFDFAECIVLLSYLNKPSTRIERNEGISIEDVREKFGI